MKHTPEPWEQSGTNIIDSRGFYLGECRSEKGAARIVACVNACAGMEDPAKEIFRLHAELQAMQPTIDLLQKKNAELKTELANVRKERNALYIRLKSKRP